MEIIGNLRRSEKPTSVALGFFDGLHRGHREVINAAIEYANNHNILPAVFTTVQSPRSVITGKSVKQIITHEEKTARLEGMGIKRVYIIDFNDIMNISAEDFIKHIVKECFGARHVSCGFNYHFGKGGAGDISSLRELCGEAGIEAASKNHIDYENEPISSTRIRECISCGDIRAVNDMLGYEYGFRLPVIHGRRLGRKMGIPTINQRFPTELVCPRFGAYASVAFVGGKRYCGVSNIGVKPTVGSDETLIETWLPEYDGAELYGEDIDIRLIDYIRVERKFDSIEGLKKEILKNGEQAREIFAEYLKR